MQRTTRLVAPVRIAVQTALLVLTLVVVATPAARAQDAAAPVQAQETEQEHSSVYLWGDSKKPAGYVRSREPAKGGAYNYLQMGLAGGVVLCMVGVIFWLVRRSTRERREEPT